MLNSGLIVLKWMRRCSFVYYNVKNNLTLKKNKQTNPLFFSQNPEGVMPTCLQDLGEKTECWEATEYPKQMVQFMKELHDKSFTVKIDEKIYNFSMQCTPDMKQLLYFALPHESDFQEP